MTRSYYDSMETSKATSSRETPKIIIMRLTRSRVYLLALFNASLIRGAKYNLQIKKKERANPRKYLFPRN